MSKYAVYGSSRIYHLMRDETHTKCGINVFASRSGSHYQGGWSPLEMVESIPAGLRLCQHCSGENNRKKGVKE